MIELLNYLKKRQKYFYMIQHYIFGKYFKYCKSNFTVPTTDSLNKKNNEDAKKLTKDFEGNAV